MRGHEIHSWEVTWADPRPDGRIPIRLQVGDVDELTSWPVHWAVRFRLSLAHRFSTSDYHVHKAEIGAA